MGYISKFKCVIAFIAMLALSASAYAAPITGSVSFGGGAVPKGTNSFLTATTVDIIGDVAGVSCAISTSCTGTYAGLTGFFGGVYNDFSYDPLAAPVTPLWSFNFGPNTYSFNLEQVTIVSRTANFLSLTGTGTLFATGYDPTPGLWSFSADRSSSTVNAAFSATNDVPQVPEPATLMMFGIGLIGGATFMNRRRRQLLQ